MISDKLITKIKINYKNQNFINYCNLLKIDYSNMNDEDFKKKLIELKESYIKHFALNIHKKYINNLDSCMNNIENNYEKLKKIISNIDYLINFNSEEEEEEDEDEIFLSSNNIDLNINETSKTKSKNKFYINSNYIDEYSN